jgi:ribonucleoside-diphosphate reductase beta chain
VSNGAVIPALRISSAGSSRWASATAAAEGIVGDNILHVVREVVTAPGSNLSGPARYEENIHADSLVYMISSLGINPHECEAMFEDIATIKRKPISW